MAQYIEATDTLTPAPTVEWALKHPQVTGPTGDKDSLCWCAGRPLLVQPSLSHLPEEPSPDPCSWHQPGLSSAICSMDISAQPCPEGGTVSQLCRDIILSDMFSIHLWPQGAPQAELPAVLP